MATTLTIAQALDIAAKAKAMVAINDLKLIYTPLTDEFVCQVVAAVYDEMLEVVTPPA